MSEPRIHAPELPSDLEWFNTDQPVRLADQRGKVVLLDFWTYCCVNCLHVLPDLRFLEDKYPDDLVVIGVHSPKFPNERVGEQVQKAINRYHIHHPVVNDPKLTMWRQYGIRAWPSMILIDPEGYVLGVLRGEGRRRQLDMLIEEQLEKAEQAGIRSPSTLETHPRPEPFSTLSFPGKVLASGNRLYISDSGHNRIVEATLDGRVSRLFGSRGGGLTDGQGEDAAFRNPQGLVKVDDFLYVADTDNHVIRRIHLRDGDVQTIAGTGKLGRSKETFFTDPMQAPLNSPWDLAYRDGTLYIAMAGSHQLWALQLGQNTLSRFVGSGREGIDDGDAEQATMAQPSGLAMAEDTLYVADSETSAVRVVRLDGGRTRTVVGTGLFDFGDQDGVGQAARLQHPLGVAYDAARKRVWIADTYNSKIKYMSTKSNEVSTQQLCLRLNEPGGVSLQGDRLWIANTNGHEILCLDINEDLCEVVDIHE